jgi:ADP-heptose:LPS heptosyltransferase
MTRPLLVAYRALGLGDLLTGIPALRALARAFPEHRRVLAAPRALEPLALRSGAVHAVVDAAPLAPLPEELHGADVAVNLHGRGPQSTELLAASRPRRLIAFGERPRWRAEEHEVGRWCRLLEESGIPADPRDLDLDGPPSDPGGPLVIHPGAASAARRWPEERWAEVARAADRPVLITGSGGERELAARIASAAGLPGDAVLAGRTGLAELADVVARAARVACGDTGVAHLATALGTPSVVLFGPTPPDEWGPPRDRPRHRVLWSGRRGDPHAGEPDPGLLAISVEDVLAALSI